MRKRKIGVTDCSKYDAYANWIARDGDVETVKLSYKDNSFDAIKDCDGIVLTGGEDVHPRFYNKPDYYEWCHKHDIDEQRDEFEMKVLQQSQDQKLPVLGICRGLQIANVFFGGTLVPDIPAFGKFNHSKKDGNDRYHEITVDANSFLEKCARRSNGPVNSAHHQSAEIVGPALVTSALSPEGVIECLEWKDPAEKPYLLLVQWHPERIKDQENPFSANVRKSFLDAVKQQVDVQKTLA
jgi:putative glutamine amidotransferase